MATRKPKDPNAPPKAPKGDDSARRIQLAMPEAYTSEAPGLAERAGMPVSDVRAIFREAAENHLAAMPGPAQLVAAHLKAKAAAFENPDAL